jgi:hypothetical protein
MIKELYTRNWDYTVYQVNDQKVISVVFFGMVDYHRSFFLLPDEIPQDFELLKTLSEYIRNNYESYKDREIIPAITAESLT